MREAAENAFTRGGEEEGAIYVNFRAILRQFPDPFGRSRHKQREGEKSTRAREENASCESSEHFHIARILPRNVPEIKLDNTSVYRSQKKYRVLFITRQ